MHLIDHFQKTVVPEGSRYVRVPLMAPHSMGQFESGQLIPEVSVHDALWGLKRYHAILLVDDPDEDVKPLMADAEEALKERLSQDMICATVERTTSLEGLHRVVHDPVYGCLNRKEFPWWGVSRLNLEGEAWDRRSIFRAKGLQPSPLSERLVVLAHRLTEERVYDWLDFFVEGQVLGVIADDAIPEGQSWLVTVNYGDVYVMDKHNFKFHPFMSNPRYVEGSPIKASKVVVTSEYRPELDPHLEEYIEGYRCHALIEVILAFGYTRPASILVITEGHSEGVM